MRRMKWISVAAAVALTAVASPAQQMTKAKAGVDVGTPASLTLASTADTLPKDSVAKVTAARDTLHLATQVQPTRRVQHKAKGALVGALAGGVIGALLGAASYQRPRCEPGTLMCGFMDFGRGGNAAIGGVLGVVAGTVVGTVVGAAGTTERQPATSSRR